jgi:hypothetical protein
MILRGVCWLSRLNHLQYLEREPTSSGIPASGALACAPKHVLALLGVPAFDRGTAVGESERTLAESGSGPRPMCGLPEVDSEILDTTVHTTAVRETRSGRPGEVTTARTKANRATSPC